MSERVEIDRVDDGGPAFPDQFGGSEGMTLRDWFAGQALAAIIQSGESVSANGDSADAYMYADAMLKARK